MPIPTANRKTAERERRQVGEIDEGHEEQDALLKAVDDQRKRDGELVRLARDQPEKVAAAQALGDRQLGHAQFVSQTQPQICQKLLDSNVGAHEREPVALVVDDECRGKDQPLGKQRIRALRDSLRHITHDHDQERVGQASRNREHKHPFEVAPGRALDEIQDRHGINPLLIQLTPSASGEGEVRSAVQFLLHRVRCSGQPCSSSDRHA